MTLFDVSLFTSLVLSIFVDCLKLAAVVFIVWKFWPLFKELLAACVDFFTTLFRSAKVGGKKAKVKVVKPEDNKS
jgi:hypothetical protein